VHESTLPRTLTRAQEARRQRVVDAAMELGLEGGYEAVQMRDVAAQAHVAMGTVYRYFSSKDHLLAAALVFWVEQLDARLAQVPARGTIASERVLDVLERALRAMGRQPQLVAAVFASLASPDVAAIECQQQMGAVMDGIVIRAIATVPMLHGSITIESTIGSPASTLTPRPNCHPWASAMAPRIPV